MSRLIGLMSVIALVGLASTSVAGSETYWLGQIYPWVQPRGAFGFGVKPGFQDGWDGEPPLDILTYGAGTYLVLFRTNGPSWSGPTGFYSADLESPIRAGASKTWSDIRLWSYDYTPPLGNRVGTWYVKDWPAPDGYWGRLVLDYTPASMNWTGETEWFFPLMGGGYNVPALPCPITDDPYDPNNVTRMHLTVYTYPVPEPSSLAALGLALAGVGIGVVRRRG